MNNIGFHSDSDNIYILVHGGNVSKQTWESLSDVTIDIASEALGGSVWMCVRECLMQHGHKVYAPTLGDERINTLSDHINQITQFILSRNLKDIILVGHSYGGMVITGVADAVADRIKSLCYVDAALPNPNQSLYDLLSLNGYDPNLIIPNNPAAYIEKIAFSPSTVKQLPQYFIECSKSDFSQLCQSNQYQLAFNTACHVRWTLTMGHLPMATQPQALADCLMAIAD